MASSYFTCRHCGQRCVRNFRIKGGQHYCGSRACQQARKNKWERDKLHRDESYRLHRSSVKKYCYQRHRGDRYQCSYRENHPHYTASNRTQQHDRNLRRISAKASASKIVKTDALDATSLIAGGLYVLSPFCESDTKKIVKTDALIVELRTCGQMQEFIHHSGP